MSHLFVIIFGMQAIAGMRSGEAAPQGRSLPPLELVGPAQRVEPVRVAKVRLRGDHFELMSDWTSYGPMQRGFCLRYTYDCFESDSTDVLTLRPTDTSPGCNPPDSPDHRWRFADEFNNPFVSADMTMGSGLVDGFLHAWSWTVGAAEADSDGDNRPDSPCFLLLAIYDSMDTTGCTDDGSSFLDALIFDFSPLPSSQEYYFAAIDLDRLSVQLLPPPDRVGGYQLFYSLSSDPSDPILPEGIDSLTQLGVAVQPMLWGTADAEPINDGRIGTQNAGQFDDVNPTDGQHQLANECIDYHLGACPEPLGAMTGFLSLMQVNCRPCGDLNFDGQVDLSDLTMLLGSFGQPNSGGSCADLDQDGVCGLGDLSILLSRYGTSCDPCNP